MKIHVVAAVAAALLVNPSISVAQARAKPRLEETSGDVRGGRAARAAAARTEARAAAADAIGDLELGRNLTYLGVAQTATVSLTPDCSVAFPDERCVALAPSPEWTFFQETDLARIDVPAKATQSIMCFSLTPFTLFEFLNDTGMPQFDAAFGASALIVLENPVLADPALIDPVTELPYGGRAEMVFGTYSESRSLAVDERAYKRLSFTRSCIGGLLSKRALVEAWGLSPAQADEFFRQPTTLRLGAIGHASLVSWANYFYGLRLYGD